MKKRIPYIPHKGKSKKEIYLALESLRQQGYDIPLPQKKTKIKKPTLLQEKHAGHKWILERGAWGPHSARYICLDCEGAHIKWVSTKKSG